MLKAIGNRVVVQPDAPETISKGGIHLVDTSSNMITGVVLDVGSECYDVSVGDKVLYNGYATKITVDGVEVIVVKEEDLLGIL